MLEILAQPELPVVTLIVAHRSFVEAAIARDMLEGPVERNMPAAAADHHRELALMVELLGEIERRAEQRLAMADERAGMAQEDLRIVARGLQPALLDMRLEVERERPDRVRFRDRRQEGDRRD